MRAPKVYTMKLNAVPFDATKAGLKTVEIRLNDEKRRAIQAGDRLEFHREDTAEALTTTVLAIRIYPTLAELIQSEDFNKTGGIYKSRSAWQNAIDGYYSPADQSRYGLLAIEISLNDSR